MNFTRTCIACRKKDNKYSFIRIVSDNGKAVIDTHSTSNSRGIYICNDKNCFGRILKSKNLSKVIKNGINVDSLKSLIVEMEDM